MNTFLIMREEFVCLALLVYLLVYSYKFVSEERFFIRLTYFAIGHVSFDVITVYTVNHIDEVPSWLNRTCHAAFYVFAILFCCELFRYVLRIAYPEDRPVVRGRWVYLVPAVYLLLIPFLKIDYLQGNGSMYSFGQCVFVGYALAMLFFFASVFLIIRKWKKLPSNVTKALFPGFLFMAIAVVLQIFYPELLFTGADITLVTGGVFFALVNPLEKYREQAYFDSAFGIKNRNAYLEDVKKLLKSSQEELVKEKLTLVLFDMNGLKQVNDTYGHAKGDEYLRNLTNILKSELKHSKDVYRMGGDEFHAVYVQTELDVVLKELELVMKRCAEKETGTSIPLSVSYGWAVLNDQESFDDLEVNADKKMFETKRKLYANPVFDRRQRER